MFTLVAVLGLGFGGLVLGVVAAEVYRGYLHSGPNRVSRRDESDLFWGMAILLVAASAMRVATGVAIAAKLL